MILDGAGPDTEEKPDVSPQDGGDEVAPQQLDQVKGEETQVPRPESRRERAARANRESMERMESLSKEVKELASVRETVEELRRANASLIEEFRSSRSAPRQDAPPPASDPAVEVEAMKALDDIQSAMAKGDWDAYAAAQRRLIRAEARASVQQMPQQPQMPPELAALRAEFHKVHAHPAGEYAYRMHEAMLPQNVRGIDRMRRAYEAAEAQLYSSTKPRAPAAQQRAAMTAPARASSAASTTPTIRLPAGLTMEKVRDIARKARMTAEEYLREYAKLHPEDVIDGE